MSKIRDRRIACSRGVEPTLRRRRLLAARRYAAGSVPRIAIMLGHWDGGSVVGSAGAQSQHPGEKR